MNEDEVEKYTNAKLTHSMMKQTLFVPYEYDIQVLLYFMHAHFPSVIAEVGQDEVQATIDESNGEKPSATKKKHDLKLIIGSDEPTLFNQQKPPTQDMKHYGVTLKYYYTAMKLKI